MADEQVVYLDGNPRAKLIVAEKPGPPGTIASWSAVIRPRVLTGWPTPCDSGKLGPTH